MCYAFVRLYGKNIYIFRAVLPQHLIQVTLHTQDNFLWMPNYSLRPSECETKLFSKHFGMGYVKMLVFMATQSGFENGVMPT